MHQLWHFQVDLLSIRHRESRAIFLSLGSAVDIDFFKTGSWGLWSVGMVMVSPYTQCFSHIKFKDYFQWLAFYISAVALIWCKTVRCVSIFPGTRLLPGLSGIHHYEYNVSLWI